MEVKFTLKSFFPMKNIAPFLGTDFSAVTTNLSEQTEKFGLGLWDNSKYYKVYLPKVYDSTNSDYVSFTGHRCRLTSSGELTMTYGNVWSLAVTIRCLADESKPAGQEFMTVLRSDASAI